MTYTPHTQQDVEHMLETIGLESVGDLYRTIPEQLRGATFDLPPGMTELELTRLMRGYAAINRPTSRVTSYRGAGLYEHAVPAVVDAMANRGEFATAYTPYQAEASQGTLQSIYEFQSMLCALTGLEVANASLYDGASSLAEAALMALRITGRDRLLVSRGVHPEYRDTLRTYVHGLPVTVDTLDVSNGTTNTAQLRERIDDRTAVVMIQLPNFLGCIEPLRELIAVVHEHGALCIVCTTDPVTLGVLEAPGVCGADVVVGEAQTLGSPLSYGGPSLGFFTTRATWIRKVPGRLVGRTVDSAQRTGYVLTLQAREQHIRREKATSNICTNQGLVALRATVFLAALGPHGLRECAELNYAMGHALRDVLVQQPYFRQKFTQPFFHECVIELTDPGLRLGLEGALREAGIVGGLPLDEVDPSLTHCSLWCATETITAEHLQHLSKVLQHVGH